MNYSAAPLYVANFRIEFTTTPPSKVFYALLADQHVGKVMAGLAATGELCRLAFAKGHTAEDILCAWQAEWPRTEFLRDTQQIKENFGDMLTGQPVQKNFAVKMVGTSFQQAVWRAMLAIPAGAVQSYGDIARAIGSPKAARAVGAACGANPVPLLVPCHRIVAGDGSLGGFGGGLDIKRKLLTAEGYGLLQRAA